MLSCTLARSLNYIRWHIMRAKCVCLYAKGRPFVTPFCSVLIKRAKEILLLYTNFDKTHCIYGLMSDYSKSYRGIKSNCLCTLEDEHCTHSLWFNPRRYLLNVVTSALTLQVVTFSSIFSVGRASRMTFGIKTRSVFHRKKLLPCAIYHCIEIYLHDSTGATSVTRMPVLFAVSRFVLASATQITAEESTVSMYTRAERPFRLLKTISVTLNPLTKNEKKKETDQSFLRTRRSSRRCSQISAHGFHVVFATRVCRKGRALASGNVTVAFTERFATGPRFVTSNWRRRHSECTCGTMNSDPPTTTNTTTTMTTTMTITASTTTTKSRRGRAEGERGGPTVPRGGTLRGIIMLVLQLAKRQGYPAETLTLRAAKCQCEESMSAA